MKEVDAVVKTVVEGLKSIAQGVEAIAKKLEDGLPKEKPKTKAKRKTPKKQKQAAVKGKKRPATAVDTVLAVIQKARKGVSTATIAEKTGYDKKKVANAIYKLKKSGKIKNLSRGVFIKA